MSICSVNPFGKPNELAPCRGPFSFTANVDCRVCNVAVWSICHEIDICTGIRISHSVEHLVDDRLFLSRKVIGRAEGRYIYVLHGHWTIVGDILRTVEVEVYDLAIKMVNCWIDEVHSRKVAAQQNPRLQLLQHWPV